MLNDQRIKQTIYSDPASQPQVPLPSARWDLHNYGALHRGKKNGAQARKSRHDVAKTLGKHIGDHLSLSYERMSNDLSTPQWGKEKTWNRKNLPTANPVAVWVFFWSLLIRFWVALPMLHQRLFTVYIVPLLLCSYPIHGHRRFVSNHLLVASSWWFQPIPGAVVKSLSPVETI